jgi:hypothetical protein
MQAAISATAAKTTMMLLQKASPRSSAATNPVVVATLEISG